MGTRGGRSAGNAWREVCGERVEVGLRERVEVGLRERVEVGLRERVEVGLRGTRAARPVGKGADVYV